MRTVTYRCDKCGDEDTSNKMDLTEIFVGTSGSSYAIGKNLSQEWCRQCLISVGIVHPSYAKDKSNVPEVQEVTLEDMMRDMIRKEIDNQ